MEKLEPIRHLGWAYATSCPIATAIGLAIPAHKKSLAIRDRQG
jgi:hypothetical protein